MTSRRPPDEQTSEFLASSDSWFRPTMIRTGPDGALWIADMYRLVIEHPQWIPIEWQRQLELRAGHDRGRIYRVYPVDKPPRAIPRFDNLRPEDLVKSLDSVNGWQRDLVQELIVESCVRQLGGGPESTFAKFAGMYREPLLRMATTSPNPLARLHAWCTLEGLKALKPGDLARGLADSDPGVRRTAARLCESGSLNDQEWQGLRNLATDADARVRLQVACSLGNRSETNAAVILGEMLIVETDRHVLAGAMSSLTEGNIESVLRQVLLAKDRESANLTCLEMLLSQAAAFGNRGAVESLLAEIAKPAEGAYADWQLRAVFRLISVTRRQEESVEALVKSAPLLDTMFTAAREIAGNPEADEPLRIAAVSLLGQRSSGREADLQALSNLLSPQVSSAIQVAVVEALGRTREQTVPGILLNSWQGLTPAVRSQAMDVLLSRDAWLREFLPAVERGDVLPQDIDAVRRQRLLSHSVAEVRERAQSLFATRHTTDRVKVVEQFQDAIAALSGDPSRGRQVFAKICSQCHKLGDLGHEVGPDLVALTDKSPASLLVAILDPNRAVETKFLNYVAVTIEGKQHDGLLAAETGNSLTLRGPEAKDTVLLRTDIEALKGTARSMMPEGLEKDLKAQDLADVIAFVRAAGPIPRHKSFPGNTPQIVGPEKDGSLLLTTATCEIFGPTLVLETKHRNLGYWSSPDDYAAWGIDVPKSGTYSVHFDWACDNGCAGNLVELSASGGSLRVAVPGTGNWDTYRQASLGHLRLEKGRHRLVARPGGAIRNGALMDLRSIRLVPAN